MKAWTKVFLVIFFLTVAFSSDAVAQKKWTVMVFLNGDSNLSEAGDDDMTEMMKVGSSEDVDIIVLQDHEGSDGCQRHYVLKGSCETEMLPELDMGDWREAVNFFKWGADNYPAEKYFFTIWNHGGGWNKEDGTPVKDVSWDDDSGNHIETTDLREMSKQMHDYIGRKVDVIGFDCCLMAMAEVAYEMKDYALYMVGAEETEPFDGWAYDDWLVTLVEDADMTTAEMLKKHVKAYNDSYTGDIQNNNPWFPFHNRVRHTEEGKGSQGAEEVNQSAFDLTKFDEFVSVINEFSDTLIQRTDMTDAVRDALQETQGFAADGSKDLYDFLKRIKQGTDDAVVTEQADNVMELLKGDNPLIVANGYHGDALKDSHGLAIYIPSKYGYKNNIDEYRELSFAKDCKWDEFVQSIHFPHKAMVSIKNIKANDTDGDGKFSPGEMVEFIVTLENEGSKQGSNISISITTDNTNTEANSSTIVLDSIGPVCEAEATGLSVMISESCPEMEAINFTVTVSMDGNETCSKDHSIVVRLPFVCENKVLLLLKDGQEFITTFYKDALNAAGIGFDYWNISVEGKIPADMLRKYADGTVIFAAPDTSDASNVDEQDLIALLEAGGSLFITGQDVGYKLKNSDFYNEYLCAKYIQDNTKINDISGSSIFEGCSFNITGGDGADNMKWPDEIDARDGAELIFKYLEKVDENQDTDGENAVDDGSHTDNVKDIQSSGGAGLFVDNGTYKAVYLAFNFESINKAEARNELMEKIMVMLSNSSKDRLTHLDTLEEITDNRAACKAEIAYSAALNSIISQIELGNFSSITEISSNSGVNARMIRNDLREYCLNSARGGNENARIALQYLN